jgi:predicted RNA-binding Zn ribbon-like protein
MPAKHLLMEEDRMAVDTTRPRFYGGRACLDFANTVEPRNAATDRDHVTSYAELVSWARLADLVDEPLAAALRRAADADPAAAAAAHGEAVVLREAIYRTFEAVAGGREPAPVDLVVISDAYRDGLHHADLRATSEGFTWTYRDEPDLRRPLWPVAASAVELLASPELSRVKVCPETCAWLFLDTTKNGRRVWCSMRECGVGAKVRRQAERRAAGR